LEVNMAGRHRIAVAVSLYLIFFGIALRFFLAGRHGLAFVVLISAALLIIVGFGRIGGYR
jgi:uncharacterized membrane protein